MTRKITLSVILILLIFACYEVIFGEYEFIREKIPSVSQLQTSSKALDTSVANLERVSGTDYESKKETLTTTIEEYKKAKEQYESIVPTNTGAQTELEGTALKDIYDIDFLWTIVGNYATEEGINLKFDVKKNNTSLSSINNTSSNYVVCDLEFVITGHYINLTDFIYDIEDDDRLNFEINDFSMAKLEDRKDIVDKAVDLTSDPDWYDENEEEEKVDENELQVTLVVREVKINSHNLIESNGVVGDIVNNITNSSGQQTTTTDRTSTNTSTTTNTQNTN